MDAQPPAGTRRHPEAPRSVRIPLRDLEPLIPTSRRKRPADPEEMLDLPASLAFSHIVPTIPLAWLSEALPGFVGRSEDVVRLPIASLAAAWTPTPATSEPDDESRFAPPPGAGIKPPFRTASSSLRDHLATEAVEAEVEEAPAAVDNQQPATGGLAEMIPNLPVFTRLEVPPVAATREDPPCSAQEDLQALFLTEETLTHPRVLELCGSLPGIRSCVLTQGSDIIASHNIPAGVDIRSLSSSAEEMLDAMHEASSRMGLGEMPAITLHTGKGPVSVFRKLALTMVVFHSDRAFVPGVREKITAALGGMAGATQALDAPHAD
jgi:hypothetical protein